MKTTIELPLLPLRDVVVYPHMVIPLFVGREKSIEALESAMAGDKQILLVAQKNPADDDVPAGIVDEDDCEDDCNCQSGGMRRHEAHEDRAEEYRRFCEAYLSVGVARQRVIV